MFSSPSITARISLARARSAALVTNAINIAFALTYSLAQKRSLTVSLGGAFVLWALLNFPTGFFAWTLPTAIVFNVVVLAVSLWLSASLRHVQVAASSAHWLRSGDARCDGRAPGRQPW